MKKLILVSLIILFSFYKVNCQIKNGNVEYNLIFSKDEKLEKGALSEYYKQATENAKYVIFKLDFDYDQMYFYPLDLLNIGQNNTNFSLSFSGVVGKIYKEKSSSFVFTELKNNMFGNYILKQEITLNWKISDEFKLIQDFKCYKATTSITFNNGVGEFKKDIIAWYCPQIPFSIGPKGFTGLPGLILELQENNVLFAAKKINFNNKEFKFPGKLKGEIISEAEYIKIIEDNMKAIENGK